MVDVISNFACGEQLKAIGKLIEFKLPIAFQVCQVIHLYQKALTKPYQHKLFGLWPLLG